MVEELENLRRVLEENGLKINREKTKYPRPRNCQIKKTITLPRKRRKGEKGEKLRRAFACNLRNHGILIVIN